MLIKIYIGLVYEHLYLVIIFSSLVHHHVRDVKHDSRVSSNRHYCNVFRFSHRLVHNTPCWWCFKSSFFFRCGFVFATRSAHKITQHNYFFSCGIFETHWRVSVHAFCFLDTFTSLHSLLDDTEMYIETLHIYQKEHIGKIYMCTCTRVFYLLSLS